MKNNKPSSKKNKIERTVWSIIGAALLIIILASFFTKSQDPMQTAPTPEIIAQGEKLFHEYCAQCHGQNAVGESAAHRSGGLKNEGGYWAPALNGTAHAWHHKDEDLFKIVKEGSIAGDSPMKGFGDRLSDEEIASIIHYFQSLWPMEIKLKILERKTQ